MAWPSNAQRMCCQVYCDVAINLQYVGHEQHVRHRVDLVMT